MEEGVEPSFPALQEIFDSSKTHLYKLMTKNSKTNMLL